MFFEILFASQSGGAKRTKKQFIRNFSNVFRVPLAQINVIPQSRGILVSVVTVRAPFVIHGYFFLLRLEVITNVDSQIFGKTLSVIHQQLLSRFDVAASSIVQISPILKRHHVLLRDVPCAVDESVRQQKKKLLKFSFSFKTDRKFPGGDCPKLSIRH